MPGADVQRLFLLAGFTNSALFLERTGYGTIKAAVVYYF